MKQQVEKKYCKTCNGEIPRGNSTPSEYSRRQFCSRRCIRWKEKKDDPRAYDRNCIQCGTLISITLPQWSDRAPQNLPVKFCSNKCKSDFQRVHSIYKKVCPECGVTFERKKGEDYRGFMKRQFCKRECKSIHYWKVKKPQVAASPNRSLLNGKIWGSITEIEIKIAELKENGFSLSSNGNTRQHVWRENPEGYGVQWLTNREGGQKTWHYTNSRKVFANYSGVNELD